MSRRQEDVSRVRERYRSTAVRSVRGQYQAAQEPRAADRGVLDVRRRGFEDVKLLIIGDEISKYATLRRPSTG